ncbi:MAG TPA: putative metal-dependent hydrolase [Pseudacidobacterium sp.]|nr:putative metal-dependent hydrolase [Pseudacidobacterium sp.]
MRYPVGDFSGPIEQTPQQRRASVATIAALPENLRSAVHGLTDTQLDTPYREDGWTVRQLVHHVADSHMNAYVRNRRALTEDWPAVPAYDEKLWAKLPDACSLPVDVSLNLLEGLHRRWVALFDSLTDADWQRGYMHSELGEQKLAHVLQLYDWHCRHHVAHVTELRRRMGW